MTPIRFRDLVFRPKDTAGCLEEMVLITSHNFESYFSIFLRLLGQTIRQESQREHNPCPRFLTSFACIPPFPIRRYILRR
jgi:hypothetical protein